METASFGEITLGENWHLDLSSVTNRKVLCDFDQAINLDGSQFLYI